MNKLFTLLFLCGISVAASAAALPNRGENYYCRPGDVWAEGLSSHDGVAHLPEKCIYTDLAGSPSPGAVIQVPSGASVDAALATAVCGDTLELAAGGVFAPFTLAAKGCDAAHWITIRSSAPNSALPGQGHRINPSYAGVPSLQDRPPFSGGKSNVMAKIVTNQQSTPAISIPATGVANFYRLGPGLEITTGPTPVIQYGLVRLGSNADHIILDRDWIHGRDSFTTFVDDELGVFVAGSTYVAVVNSYLNDFKCRAGFMCTDSKDFAGGDGALMPHWEGAWKLYNNFLEAAGENVLHGGNLTGNQVPSDLEYRENHFYKPPSWQACTYLVSCYLVKNLFEIKNGQRILLEGNTLENSWGGYSQKGFGLLLTPRGDWASDLDITIRYNHFKNVASVIALDATTICKDSYLVNHVCPTQIVDSGPSGRYSLHDDLWENVDPDLYKGSGNTQIISQYTVNPPLHDIVINHVTVITSRTLILSLFTAPTNPQPQMGQFTYTNNIVIARGGVWNAGGAVCPVDDNPIVTFNQCFTNYTVTNNAIIGWDQNPPVNSIKPWPTGNLTPATPQNVFVNFAQSGGDYHVVAPYLTAGSDGKALGADIDTINAWTANIQ